MSVHGVLEGRNYQGRLFYRSVTELIGTDEFHASQLDIQDNVSVPTSYTTSDEYASTDSHSQRDDGEDAEEESAVVDAAADDGNLPVFCSSRATALHKAYPLCGFVVPSCILTILSCFFSGTMESLTAVEDPEDEEQD